MLADRRPYLDLVASRGYRRLPVMKTVLSGIQPSGRPHLGNYFGAIRQHIQLQERADARGFYFIADYHALTSSREPEKLREAVRDVALTYLALGLDPQRAAAVHTRVHAAPSSPSLPLQLP